MAFSGHYDKHSVLKNQDWINIQLDRNKSIIKYLGELQILQLPVSYFIHVLIHHTFFIYKEISSTQKLLAGNGLPTT